MAKKVKSEVRKKRGGGKAFLRRFASIAILSLAGLYLILHLILASQPVQRRVLDEIQKALAGSGLELKIESIEFAAFAPKIYLNRVTIKTLKTAPVVFPNPIGIDKVKIEFSPIALISGRIVIEDAALFHPRIVLPSADQLYRRIDEQLKSRKRVELQGGFFKVVIKKFGVVDALIDISSKDPSFEVRSRSLSVAVENNLGGQQTITASSNHLELKRGALNLALNNFDIDLDTSARSIRVNRALIAGGDLYINLKGTSNIPQGKEKYPNLVNVSYDIRLPVGLLNSIPEIDVAKVEGVIKSAGTVKLANNNFGGNGSIEYEKIAVDGYRVGSGRIGYELSGEKLALNDLRLQYGEGVISAKAVNIGLKDKYPVQGQLAVSDVKLEGILEYLKQHNMPLHMGVSGSLALSGTFKPFELNGDIDAKLANFEVYNPKKFAASIKEKIIEIPDGRIAGRLTFNLEKFLFQTKINALGGTVETDGFLSYENYAKLKVKGDGVSLTQLAHIAELDLAGIAKVTADVDVQGKNVKIAGNFEANDGEVANIILGQVKGQAYYQDELLSFENLEVPSTLEPVHGSGFVDFNPEHTHYKFNVEGKRLEVDQAFHSFSKKKLAFAAPRGGEVAARVLIEGGHDNDGVEVIASGQAKNFKWYDEDWLSSQFAVTFRPKVTELSRALMMKKNGGLEVKGSFADAHSRLQFISHGLRIEELQWIGKAPLTGQIVGQLTLQGDLKHPEGSGELRLVNSGFRSKAMPDSLVRIRTENQKLELLGRFFGEKLRGRVAKPVKSKTNWDLLFYFEDFDFTPLVAASLGQDLPTVTEVVASGEVGLSGDISDWKTFRGKGSVSELALGLRGTPMKNKTPIRLSVEQGAIELDRVVLSGKDSEINVEMKLVPNQSILADVDGKVDLEYLQPFIPGLEFGTGHVSAGLRFSGAPEKFELLGNVTLQDGTFRITGLQDDFRNAQVQLSASHDRVNIDRFQATVNGGMIEATGDVRIDRFKKLVPNIRFTANRVTMRTGNYLTTRLSGDFNLKGETTPYLLSGKCRVLEANLTQFTAGEKRREETPRIIKFDVNCDARQKVFVRTDVMNAEFKGTFNLLGDNTKIGLLGSAESIQGSVFFRERRFNLTSGNVKFESPTDIAPRFNVAGRANVREGKSSQPGQINPNQEYEVNLLVYGTPENYKIRLTSSPELAEAEITSLLLLGTTSRSQNPDGSAVDLGTTLVGQIPLQKKLENQLGLDIRFNTQTSKATPTATGQTPTSSSTTAQASSASTDITVPSVQIQKSVMEGTTVSYSNTLENVPVREFKIEHMLSDKFTVNGVAVDRSRVGTESQSSQSYGVDVRYRFSFE